jgi:hypothetical protein
MDRKYSYSVTLENAYKSYMKKTKKDIPNRLSKADFSKLFNTFVQERFKLTMRDSVKWKLPFNLGTVYVVKMHKPKIWLKWPSKKANKPVFIFNDATGGYSYSVVVTRPKHWKNQDICSLKKSRNLKALLVSEINRYVDEGLYPPAHLIVNARNKRKRPRF